MLFTFIKSWFFRNHSADFHQISHWSFCWNVIDSLFKWSCSIDCQAHIFFFKTKNCSNDDIFICWDDRIGKMLHNICMSAVALSLRWANRGPWASCSYFLETSSNFEMLSDTDQCKTHASLLPGNLTDQYHKKASSVKSMADNLWDVSGVCTSVFVFPQSNCYIPLTKLVYLRYYSHSLMINKEKSHISIFAFVTILFIFILISCSIVCFTKSCWNKICLNQKQNG